MSGRTIDEGVANRIHKNGAASESKTSGSFCSD